MDGSRGRGRLVSLGKDVERAERELVGRARVAAKGEVDVRREILMRPLFLVCLPARDEARLGQPHRQS